MGALDKAKAHYAGMKGQKIAVPEWGATVYFDPLTLRQRAQMSSDGATGARLHARILIDFAKDAQGAPLFEDTAETMAALIGEVDGTVAMRIAHAIIGVRSDRDQTDPDEMGNGSTKTRN